MKKTIALLFAFATFAAVAELGVTVNGIDVGEGSGGGWRYDSSSRIVTVTSRGQYVLAGANTSGQVAFRVGADAEITVSELRLAGSFDSLFRVQDAATVTLCLAGTNSLNDSRECISIENGARLTITNAPGLADAEAVLTVQSGDEFSAISVGRGNVGSTEVPFLEIAGGTVRAIGGSGSAGIGGSRENNPQKGRRGKVVVSGGRVYASGGFGAAGIGGSERDYGCYYDITVTGGVVEAHGGRDAPGIGGGYDTEIGLVRILGGTVYADRGYDDGASYGGNKIPAVDLMCGHHRNGPAGRLQIGGGSVVASHGEVCPRPICISDNGSVTQTVWCATVTNLPPEKTVSVSGLSRYGTNGIVTGNDGRICLWLPVGDHGFEIDGEPYEAHVGETGSVVRKIEVPPHVVATLPSGETRGFDCLGAGVDCLNENGGGELRLCEDIAFAEFPINVRVPLKIAGAGHAVTGTVSGLNDALVLIHPSVKGRVDIENLKFQADGGESVAQAVMILGDDVDFRLTGCAFSGFANRRFGQLALVDTVGSVRIENCRFVGNEWTAGTLVSCVASPSALSPVVFEGTLFASNSCATAVSLIGAGDARTSMSVGACPFVDNDASELLKVRNGGVMLVDGVGTNPVVLDEDGYVIAGENLLLQDDAMLYLDVRSVSERVRERIVCPESDKSSVDSTKVRICAAGYAAFADGKGGVVVDTVTSHPFALQDDLGGWETYATFDEPKLKAGFYPVWAVRYENRVRGTVFDTITNGVTVSRDEKAKLYSVLRYTEDGTNTCWSMNDVPAVRLAGRTFVEGYLDASGVDVGSSLYINGGTVRLNRSVNLPFTNEIHVVRFVDPEADAGRMAIIFSNGADPLPFKRCMRVANPGWTFEPVLEPDGDSGLRLVRVADYVAWIGTDPDVGLYTDLRAAFSALAETGGELRLVATTNVTAGTGSGRVELPLDCRVGGGAVGVTVTLGSAFRRTEDVTYDWDANPARPTTLVCNGTPIEIVGGSVLKPGNVAFEGALAQTGDGWLDLADYAGSPIAVKPLRNGVIATNAVDGALKLADGVDGILRVRENGTYIYHAPYAFESRQVGNGLVELTVVSGSEREVIKMPENHSGVGSYAFVDATTGWSTNLEWGVVWYDGMTGRFTLPPPDRFPVECVMQDGTLRPLVDGTLPRDLLLTAQGGITLKCNGFEFVLDGIAATRTDVNAAVAAVVAALKLADADEDESSFIRVRNESDRFFCSCVTKFSLARAQDLTVNAVLRAEMPFLYDGCYYAMRDAVPLFETNAVTNGARRPQDRRPVLLLQDVRLPAYACTNGVLEIAGNVDLPPFDQSPFVSVANHPEVIVHQSEAADFAELTNAVDVAAWQHWLQFSGVLRRFEEMDGATNGIVCTDGPFVVGTNAQVRIEGMSITGRKFGAERAAHVFEVRPHGALVLRDTEISGFELPERELGVVYAQDFGNVWFAGATRIDGNASGGARVNVYLSSPLAHVGLPEGYEPFVGFAGLMLRDEFSWTPAFGQDDYNKGVEAWQGFRLDLDRENIAPSVRDGVAIFVLAKTGVFVDGTDVAGGSGADRGWTYADGWLEFTGAGPYVLSGTNENGLVVVRVNGDSRIVVSNLCLSVSDGARFDMMRVESGAPELTLVGANVLKSDRCALRVFEGASVKIDAADVEQSLTASSGDYCAGIGSGDTEAFGIVEIAGGSVWATGGKFAAGIGSGCDGMGGCVLISGGFVLATGGDEAAGIGLGAYAFDDYEVTVDICGGTVLASGGAGAYYDIGTTADTFGYPVRVGIDGGSVMPMNGRLSPAPVNVREETLRCVRVRLPDEWRDISTLTLAGLNGYGSKDLFAVAGKLQLWLPDGAYAFQLRNGALVQNYVAEVKGVDVDAEFGSGVIVEPPEFYPPGEPLNIRLENAGGERNAHVTAVPVNGNAGAWYYFVVAEQVTGPYEYVPGSARQAVTNGPISLEKLQSVEGHPQRFYKVGVSQIEP